MMYRQGDILLIKTIMNFDKLNSVEEKSGILMEGSITGHHHRIRNGVIKFIPINNQQVYAYVKALEECELYHDEHKTIPLPEGVYEVRRQREVTGYVED